MTAHIEILTENELRTLASADEARVMELARAEHEKSLLQHPEFAEMIEDIDPGVCRRLDLVDAIRNAPNALVRQYLYAIYVMRQDINLVAGRSFS